jgi:hypothetical protein
VNHVVKCSDDYSGVTRVVIFNETLDNPYNACVWGAVISGAISLCLRAQTTDEEVACCRKI